MLLAPYAIPSALVRRPFAAVFWPVIAPTLTLYAVAFAISPFAGDWLSRTLGEGGSVEARWLLFTLAHFVLFAAMSAWSDQIGAGPFAGPVRISREWLGVASVTGPLVHIIAISVVTALFSNGDPDWMYREGFDTSLFSPSAITPIMVAFLVLLAPLVEEVAFRGIALGCLIGRGWSPLLASVLTSAVFAGLHGNYVLPALIPVFITGLYLSFLRIASRSMAAPIAAHVSTNAVMLALAAGPVQS